MGIGDWGLGIGDCTSLRDATRSLLPRSGTAPLCYQGLGIGDWGLGIALLCETLCVACFHVVVRLRSVTRDWGLGIGDWINLLITHYSLLLTPYSLLLGIGSCFPKI
ncbi:MAG: hypothetical protein ACFKPT_14160 [Gloeotrichia echinulata GP01]